MASTTYNESQIDQILADAGWPSSEYGNAYGVIQAESGGEANPTESPASALAGAEGLFQVLVDHWNSLTWTAPTGYPHNEATYAQLLLNPEFNAEQALQLYDQSGWAPWETDSYIQSNPELLGQPINSANANVGPLGPLGPVNINGIVNGPSSGLSTPSNPSALSSVAARIVLGLVGIVLLAVFASQLLKGDNSPAQVLVQGSQSVARKGKGAAKGAAIATVAE